MGNRQVWKVARNGLGLMLAYLLLLPGLGIIIYQDFSARLISWWTIPWVLFIAGYLAVNNPFWQWQFLAFNFVFLVVQILAVSLYFSIKNRVWVNITKSYLGIGDILFFVAICPLFSPVHFCFFFIGTLILTLIMALIYQLTIKKLKTIPLAGAMSICLISYYLGLYFYGTSPYNDWPLVQFIYG